MCVGWWWSWFIVLLDEPVGISDRLQSFPGYFIYLAQLFGISEQLNFCLSFRQRVRVVYLTFLLVHLYTMEFTANVKINLQSKEVQGDFLGKGLGDGSFTHPLVIMVCIGTILSRLFLGYYLMQFYFLSPNNSFNCLSKSLMISRS
jgi:hypothetical protein